MNYDVNYFLKKFEAIPEERIIAYYAADGKGNHCALGWTENYGSAFRSAETQALIDVFSHIKPADVFNDPVYGWTVANVNNGRHPDYKQPTSKQRILAALNDIKAKQEGEAAVKEAENIITNHKTLQHELQHEVFY